jgi:hypothetical protein
VQHVEHRQDQQVHQATAEQVPQRQVGVGRLQPHRADVDDQFRQAGGAGQQDHSGQLAAQAGLFPQGVCVAGQKDAGNQDHDGRAGE